MHSGESNLVLYVIVLCISNLVHLYTGLSLRAFLYRWLSFSTWFSRTDHGWHLGEYAMWEKRTNWELGTRVPLIIRVPWMQSSVGKRSAALVELVDIYKTVCDIMAVDLPDDTVPFDGVSLRPLLEAPETATVKPYALSTFPRCAHKGMPPYGARGQKGGADNTCLEVERTDFTWMVSG
jgi:hypothetical protein